MNTKEIVEHIYYDQSLAEHKDAVLLANAVMEKRCFEAYFIHRKPVFPSLCCTFLFQTVVDHAATFRHFPLKLRLIVQAPSSKPTKSPANFATKKARLWN